MSPAADRAALLSMTRHELHAAARQYFKTAGPTEPECTVFERHRMLLLPSDCWLSDMKDALPEGTRLSFESAGLRGRGLFKAVVSPAGGPGTG